MDSVNVSALSALVRDLESQARQVKEEARKIREISKNLRSVSSEKRNHACSLIKKRQPHSVDQLSSDKVLAEMNDVGSEDEAC